MHACTFVCLIESIVPKVKGYCAVAQLHLLLLLLLLPLCSGHCFRIGRQLCQACRHFTFFSHFFAAPKSRQHFLCLVVSLCAKKHATKNSLKTLSSTFALLFAFFSSFFFFCFIFVFIVFCFIWIFLFFFCFCF